MNYNKYIFALILFSAISSKMAFACGADFDNNGIVTTADFAIWKSTYYPLQNPKGDLNLDGTVNLADVDVIRSTLNTSPNCENKKFEAYLRVFYKSPQQSSQPMHFPLMDNFQSYSKSNLLYSAKPKVALQDSVYGGIAIAFKTPVYPARNSNGSCHRVERKVAIEYYGVDVSPNSPTRLALYDAIQDSFISYVACKPDQETSQGVYVTHWRNITTSPSWSNKLIKLTVTSTDLDGISGPELLSTHTVESLLELSFPKD